MASPNCILSDGLPPLPLLKAEDRLILDPDPPSSDVEDVTIPGYTDGVTISSEDNLVDLENLIQNPGTDPPDEDCPFSDRLGRQINFWKSIHAPEHIITALDEGVDIGLVDNIEDLLPPHGISRPSFHNKDPILHAAMLAIVRQLGSRGITSQRDSRARVNCPVMLRIKPNGKYRFIWNGRPLSPYLKKFDFTYERLNQMLDGIVDGSFLGKLDLVDGFFALKIKPSQRT